jgi:hypothetical protein
MVIVKQRIAFVRRRTETLRMPNPAKDLLWVRAGTWLTHWHHDWESPVWMHWLRFMSSRHKLVRYDLAVVGCRNRMQEQSGLDRFGVRCALLQYQHQISVPQRIFE